MSKIRQILRLHCQGFSNLSIHRMAAVSRNTLKKYLRDFEMLQMTIIDIEELSDHDLEELFASFKPHRQRLGAKALVLFELFPPLPDSEMTW